MFVNIVSLLIALAVAAGAIWLTLRVRRSRNRGAKWGGTIGLGFVAVLASIFTILGAFGIYQVYAPRGNDVRDVTVAITPELIARGEELASVMCAACHSLDESLPLTGGEDILKDVPMPIGSATPPNITPAGRVADWTDGELQRAIREGTYPNGHLMPIMSTNNFRAFSQDDLDAIVAYMRTTPPVASDVESEQQLTILAMAMATLGMLPFQDPPESSEAPPPVAKGATVQYGEYVTQFIDCALCHGDTLEGGGGGLLPAGPSLRSVQAWQTTDFITAMRTGVTPGGKALDPDEMPWESVGKLDDATLAAVYDYLNSLP